MMIKARATINDGQVMVVIGLSDENIRRLQAGLPIDTDLSEIGLAGRLFIFSGETEEAMRDQIVRIAGGQGAPVHEGTPPPTSIGKN